MTSRDRVLAFIRAFVIAEGMPPTVGEIAEGLDLAKSTVHQHIVRLEEEGRLLRRGRRRYLTVVPDGD